MAIILVTQFNSFYHAFLILTAVVMSTIGVMIGLLITGQPFGIVMTGVGIITLAGVVVNNNIVLIDTYVRLKNTGMDGIEGGGAHRGAAPAAGAPDGGDDGVRTAAHGAQHERRLPGSGDRVRRAVDAVVGCSFRPRSPAVSPSPRY